MKHPNFRPMYARLEELSENERESFFNVAEVLPESCWADFPSVKQMKAVLQQRREKERGENQKALSEQAQK